MANYITEKESVCEIIRDMEKNYIFGKTILSKYVTYSMYDDVNLIDAYLNSKHKSGDVDSRGRDKPFFNIVRAAVNIWYRATDLDRKDIRFKASKSTDYFLSFLATAKLQEFMRKENIGTFLNNWGIALARYGSAVLKFVENKDGLHPMVLSWQKLIVDPIDFDANPVIEVLELTPAQLRSNENYDQEAVEELIENQKPRTTLGNEQQDQRDNYIKIYEIHGKLPRSLLTNKEKDEKDYVDQIHVVSFTGSDKEGYNDYTLYKGKERRSPYMITHLIKEEGQTLSIGAVKNLFQAQWMVNHSVKAIKDQLDLASKIIFQTSDNNYANKNVLSNIEMGQILYYNNEKSPNGISQINNTTHDITSLTSFKNQWELLGNQLNSTSDILRGENLPSGTAYRQAAIVQQEAHSNFEIMTENKGLYIERMMRDFIIPYLKKKLDTADEIVSTLEDYGIEEIDALYIPAKATKEFNRKAVRAVLERRELPDLMQEQQAVMSQLQSGQRFFKPSDIESKTWKDIFREFDWDSLEVEVTNEQGDKNTILETLSTVFQTIAANPMALKDPNMKSLFNQIIETSGGISPVQFKKPAMPMMAQPVVAGEVGVGGNQSQMQ